VKKTRKLADVAQPATLLNVNTIGASLAFVIALGTYAWTLAPTVVFVDSGELIVAAKSLGVAHPPGFPLYVLLAHLATSIPLGNVAARVNFASALFASLAIAVLFMLAIEAFQAKDAPYTVRKQKAVRAKKKENLATRHEADIPSLKSGIYELLPAAICALLFAFSRTLWSFATVAEVYTLNTLLIVLVFYLLFRWRNQFAAGSKLNNTSLNSTGLLLAAAFLFGLALGVHHVSVVVTLPALVVLLYRTAGWTFFKSKNLIYTALVLILGFVLVYAYLPLAASRSPVMNWGDPRTVEHFWWHITGRQYQVFIAFSAQRIAEQASQFGKLLAHEFGPVWFPASLSLAAMGLVEMFRYDRTTFWFAALVITCDLGYALNYEIAEDKGAYYLPAFIALALTVGFGARFLLRTLAGAWPQRHVGLAAAVVLIALVPIASFAANFPFTNRHNFFLARDYINNIESTIAPGGMLLTSDWQVYSPLLYLREIEQQRRDVVAIDISLLRRSWYFDYLKMQYPSLIANNREKVDAFFTDLKHWESQPEVFSASPGLTKRINDHFTEMIRAFVSSHTRTAPVYVTWDVGLGFNEDDAQLTQSLYEDYQLVPQGLVFQLTQERTFQPPANPRLVTTGLNDKTFKFELDDVVNVKVFPVYLNMLVNRGRYLAAYGKYEDAVTAYEQALALDPNNPDAISARNEAIKVLRK
jgi:tetratricopeptide (TPR) repeat protein